MNIRHFAGSAIDCDDCDESFFDSAEWDDENLIGAAKRNGWHIVVGDEEMVSYCPRCAYLAVA